MRAFNTLPDLRSAHILTGTPVKVLTPYLEGYTSDSEQGIPLASLTNFVPVFPALEAMFDRKIEYAQIGTTLDKFSRDGDGLWRVDYTGDNPMLWINGCPWGLDSSQDLTTQVAITAIPAIAHGANDVYVEVTGTVPTLLFHRARVAQP